MTHFQTKTLHKTSHCGVVHTYIAFTEDDPRCYPFKPHCQHMNSPYWLPYICCSASWEKLFKFQKTSSLLIISLIALNCALILQGEI